MKVVDLIARRGQESQARKDFMVKAIKDGFSFSAAEKRALKLNFGGVKHMADSNYIVDERSENAFQVCCYCNERTGRGIDDSIYVNDDGPMCEACFDNQGESYEHC